MYEQMIIIFVALGVFAVLHIVTLIMLIKLMKSKGGASGRFQAQGSLNRYTNQSQSVRQQSTGVSGVVLCKRCFTKYDSQHKVCPKCGTPW